MFVLWSWPVKAGTAEAATTATLVPSIKVRREIRPLFLILPMCTSGARDVNDYSRFEGLAACLRSIRLRSLRLRQTFDRAELIEEQEIFRAGPPPEDER